MQPVSLSPNCIGCKGMRLLLGEGEFQSLQTCKLLYNILAINNKHLFTVFSILASIVSSRKRNMQKYAVTLTQLCSMMLGSSAI